MIRSCFFIGLFWGSSLFAALTGTNDWKNVTVFAGIPGADEQGIVLDAQVVSIPGQETSFNPSLVKRGKKYLLAVRQDVSHFGYSIPPSHITLFKLDSMFRIVGEGKRLALLDDHSEDPRLFYLNEALYLSYTHVKDVSSNWKTDIAMAKIDQAKKDVMFVTPLSLAWHSNKEKNWVPVAVPEMAGDEKLYFIYSFNPLQVLRVTHEERGMTQLCYKGNRSPELDRWEAKWGIIRGGTPAIRMDNGEYLALFHSSTGYYSHYVMGAILFSAQPFQLKKISPYPLLFKGIYYPYRGYGKQSVIFPGGIVEDVNNEGRSVFYVACGINDTDVKILTLDKEALLKSLISLK